jgi:ribonuclease HI
MEATPAAPRAAPVVAFSDGACRQNGRPGARASFAAVIRHAGATIAIRGEVQPALYEFVDAGSPELGVRARPGSAARPSNNRGELLGVIYALLALAALAAEPSGGPAEPSGETATELVCDSKITVETLTRWLPGRLAKGTEGQLKNFDLVDIAWRLLGRLRRAGPVALIHVRSHQPPPPPEAGDRARLLHRGNQDADAQAALALPEGEPHYGVQVIGRVPAAVAAAVGAAAP